MKLFTFITVLLLIVSDVFAGGPSMPDGWRMPEEIELSDDWRTGKFKNAHVIGDFNGDGLIEGAYLGVSKDGRSQGLIAFVYINDREKWFVLDKQELDNTLIMCLDIYRPGKYKVLCVIDSECRQGHKKEITIKTDAIVYYRPESASSIFVWNNEEGEFERIWVSD